MNCKDLGEIADSYLSNELLVETNHDVIRHLEHCRDCRKLLAERRELRSRLKAAVVELDESRIDQGFAMRLRNELRTKSERPVRSFAGLRFAFAGLAVALLIAIGIALFLGRADDKIEQAVNSSAPAPESAIIPPTGTEIVPAMLTTVSHDAFDDHKNCALSHGLKELPISLEKAARTVDAVNLGFDQSVLNALREKFPEGVELIKAHYCLINGRHFTHVVVRLRKRTMSVLLTKMDGDSGASTPAPCGSDGNLSAACFSSGGYGIYVVADSGESETLLVANTLSEAVVRHISKTRISV